MKAVHAWRLLGAADIEAIACSLRPLVQAWADEWLPEAAVALSVAGADGHPLLRVADGEQVLAMRDGQGEPGVAVIYGSGLVGALQQQALAILGVPPCERASSGGLPAALAHYQLRDLPARLARLPAGSARQEDLYSHGHRLHAPGRKGSGAVLLRLAFDQHAVRIWLPHASVAPWCRRPVRGMQAPLRARAEALAGCRLPVRVQAGSATLALADLLALRPGNVIRLDTRPDQPLALVSGSGPGFGRCYLGLQDGRPVIQLCS